MVLYVSLRPGNKWIVNSQKPGWHLVYNYKNHICSKERMEERMKERKKNTIKSIFKENKVWTMNKQKEKKDSAMNYGQCWSGSSSEACRECGEYQRHLCTLSVCWPSSCRLICPPDLRPRFGLSCGWNSPQLTAHLEDNGRQNSSQVSGRTSNLLHPQADTHICCLMIHH